MAGTVLDSSLAPFGLILVLLFGLTFGSFANVLISRVPDKESLWTRSNCPHCDREIRWTENIPVLSYILLKARCAGCKAKISFIYPAVEIAMTALFILPFLIFHSWHQTILWLIFSLFGLPLVVIDLKLHRLPDTLTAPLFISAFIAIILFSIQEGNFSRILPSLIGCVSLITFYFAVALISKGGMGMGDVKLSAAIGLASGYFGVSAVLVSSFAAFFLGSFVGILLMVVGKAGRKTAIPFGPFMIIGQFISIATIAHTYFNFG